MKATCIQTDLLTALRIAKRLTLPQHSVLSHVLLEAKEQTLTIQAMDLTSAVELWLSAEVEEEGRAILPARELLDLVRSLPKGTVTIGTDGIQVEVGGVTFTPAVDCEDFPEQRKDAPDAKIITLDADEFQEALRSVSFCASRSEDRQQLMSVAVVPGALVASDGKRLAEYKLHELQTDRGIIPLAAVTAVEALLKLKSTTPREVGFVVDAKSAAAAIYTPCGTVTTRLIEGQLPDYVSLIPTTSEVQVLCRADALRKVIAQAAATLEPKNRVVRLDTRMGTLRIASEATAGLEVEAVSTLTGEDNFSASFTADFIIDGLKLWKKDPVVLAVNGGHKATVMSIGSWRYAFMPVMGR